MKKFVFIFVFLMIGGLFFSGLDNPTAKKLSIEEKFGSSVAEAATGTYNLDRAHSAIGFEVLHMGLVNVPGYFTDFSGSVKYDAENVTKSSVEFSAKTASVDTRVEGRDRHLRSADFFDTEKYPELTFKSTKVEKNGEMLDVTGDFTLRGVKKSITLPVKIAGFADGRRGKVMGATAEMTIDRTDYGVNYGATGGAIAKEVKIILNIEARQAK